MKLPGSGRPRYVPKARRMMRSASPRSAFSSGRTVTPASVMGFTFQPRLTSWAKQLWVAGPPRVPSRHRSVRHSPKRAMRREPVCRNRSFVGRGGVERPSLGPIRTPVADRGSRKRTNTCDFVHRCARPGSHSSPSSAHSIRTSTSMGSGWSSMPRACCSPPLSLSGQDSLVIACVPASVLGGLGFVVVVAAGHGASLSLHGDATQG